MRYWLVKSEPDSWSWDRMVEAGTTQWSGVRNHQASNNLKDMRIGDRVFFYHSNQGLEVVGIVEVAREYYPDPTDAAGRFGMVDVKAVRPFKRPVTLAQMKADPALADLLLIRHSRLSVSPVSESHWRHICTLGETAPD
jgi:predicted RNA-binding protein with PUA-like domain